jgi:diacylglycerol kinase family enzyme
MKIHVVVNKRAGTVLDWESASLQQEILAAFRAQGHEVTLHLISPDDLVPAIDRALEQGCQALIIGGGDGTVRTGAIKLMGTDVPLGILPLGTLNRLARDLKIPLEVHAAAAALANARVEAIDVGEVNGRIFLNNSLLGLTVIYSQYRQAVRGRPFLERMRGYGTAVKEILKSRRRMDVDIDHGQSRMRVRVLSMAVSNNRYLENASLMLQKETLSDGVLAAYISQHPSGWALARAIVRAMMGRFRSDPNIVHIEAHEIDVSARRSRLRLSNDGELDIVEMPLRYKIRPRALKVLVPVTESPADAQRPNVAVLARS